MTSSIRRPCAAVATHSFALNGVATARFAPLPASTWR